MPPEIRIQIANQAVVGVLGRAGRRDQCVQRRPQTLGQLRDAGDGDEAVRRVRGGVVAA